MNMNNAQKYSELVSASSKPSPILKDTVRAFAVGGGICVLGQLLLTAYDGLMSEQNAKTLVSCTLILLSALLTSFGVFDKIARFSGAGTLVPITGFANAVVSPAIEYKTEGMVLGVGAKMFTVAGPVIVYGTVASAVYGVVYWVTLLY